MSRALGGPTIDGFVVYSNVCGHVSSTEFITPHDDVESQDADMESYFVNGKPNDMDTFIKMNRRMVFPKESYIRNYKNRYVIFNLQVLPFKTEWKLIYFNACDLFIIYHVQGSAKEPYEVRGTFTERGNPDAEFTCNCPAWRYRKNAREDCKHITLIRSQL